MLDDQFQFGEFFYNRCDAASNLATHHGQFNIFFVFEAIADNGSFIIGQPQHHQQFRLGTRFQTKPVRTTVFENFFHNLTLLVHLDGKHTAIFALVAVFVDGGLKRLVQFPNAMLQNFSEAHQNGKVDAAQHQSIHQLFQVDRSGHFFARMHP